MRTYILGVSNKEDIMRSQRKLVLFIAASLDGYIATKSDTLDWLHKVEGEGDNGYSEFYLFPKEDSHLNRVKGIAQL